MPDPPPFPSPRRGRERLMPALPRSHSLHASKGVRRLQSARSGRRSVMTCAKCGQALAPGARFGPACGTPASGAAAGGRPKEFHVVGDVMQAVVVPLADGQEVQAEPGALLYMAGGVDMESRMSGGLLGGLRRLMAGESLFMTRFRGRGEGQVAFAAPYPGKLKQLDLTGAPNWLCQRDSFLCATDGIDVGIAFTKRFGAGLFGA